MLADETIIEELLLWINSSLVIVSEIHSSLSLNSIEIGDMDSSQIKSNKISNNSSSSKQPTDHEDWQQWDSKVYQNTKEYGVRFAEKVRSGISRFEVCVLTWGIFLIMHDLFKYAAQSVDSGSLEEVGNTTSQQDSKEKWVFPDQHFLFRREKIDYSNHNHIDQENSSRIDDWLVSLISFSGILDLEYSLDEWQTESLKSINDTVRLGSSRTENSAGHHDNGGGGKSESAESETENSCHLGTPEEWKTEDENQ